MLYTIYYTKINDNYMIASIDNPTQYVATCAQPCMGLLHCYYGCKYVFIDHISIVTVTYKCVIAKINIKIQFCMAIVK